MIDLPPRDLVTQSMVSDLKIILSVSPLMAEAYEGLPADQRKSVDDRFGEWCWAMIEAALEGGKS